MLNIGYLVLDNPYNIKSFSGTGFYMYKALKNQRNINVFLLGEKHLKRKSLSSIVFHLLKRTFQSYPVIHEKLKSLEFTIFSKQVSHELKTHKLDFIIAPVCSSLVAKIGSDPLSPPILFITDATPSFLKEFYNWDVKPKAFEDERKAIAKSVAVVYSSDFMAKRAQQEYKAINNHEKFKVVPFGLNLEDIPISIQTKSYSGRLNLLFVGRDWHRKGGELVISLYNLLKSNGISVNLTIIGCNPEAAKVMKDVEVIPYIDKSDIQQKNRYFDILREAHFLLLPTKADCTPMVISEANAFATPVLSSNVGGIPTLIENNKNGFLLDVDSTAEDYAKIIEDTINDNVFFQELSTSSRKMFDTRLNWDAWCDGIISIIQNINVSDTFNKKN